MRQTEDQCHAAQENTEQPQENRYDPDNNMNALANQTLDAP